MKTAARWTVLAIAFFCAVIVYSLSKDVFPAGESPSQAFFIGGIRAGFMVLFLSWVWHVTKRSSDEVSEESKKWEQDSSQSANRRLHGVSRNLKSAVGIVLIAIAILGFYGYSQWERALPYEAAIKVTGNGRLNGASKTFTGQLYNGSDWVLTRMIFTITAEEPDGSTRWSRVYEHEMVMAPLSAKDYSITVLSNGNDREFAFSIEYFGHPDLKANFDGG